MKDISKLLKKNNLTPRERIMMIIKHDIMRQKDGKGILTDSDVEALRAGGNNSYEIQEYNKYWEVWDMFVKLEVDMQAVFFTTLIALGDIEKLLIMYHYNDDVSEQGKRLNEHSTEVEIEAARKYILRNTGLEYTSLLHTYTFQSIPKSLQVDMERLHPEVRSDATYFNEEEQLAEILQDKDSLTEEEVTALTKIIMDALPWDREEMLVNKKISIAEIIFQGYFAGYEIINFGKKLAEKENISYTDDTDLRKKLSKIKNLKKKLQEVIHEAISDGLFFSEYIPLCNSTNHNTYGDDTKLEHKETLKRWLKAKKKTKAQIQQYIDDDIFVLEDRNEDLLGIHVTRKIITGESLYYSDVNLPFVEEYKKQVEQLMPYGHLHKILQRGDVVVKYGHLLMFQDIVMQVSDIVGEKATENADEYLTQINEKLEHMNVFLMSILSKLEDFLYMKNDYTYYIDMFFSDFKFDFSNVPPVPNTGIERFIKKAESMLGSEWEGLTK